MAITKIVKLIGTLLLFTGIILLSGCNNSNYPNDTMGTLVDSSQDNQYGNQFSGESVQIPGSDFESSVPVNQPINQDMDKVDSLNLNNSLQNQTDNKSTTWVNPNSNIRYTVTPKSTDNDGKSYCRDYTVNKIIDGQSQTVTERACRIDGRWVKQ
jgi:surface antigen